MGPFFATRAVRSSRTRAHLSHNGRGGDTSYLYMHALTQASAESPADARGGMIDALCYRLVPTSRPQRMHTQASAESPADARVVDAMQLRGVLLANMTVANYVMQIYIVHW